MIMHRTVKCKPFWDRIMGMPAPDIAHTALCLYRKANLLHTHVRLATHSLLASAYRQLFEFEARNSTATLQTHYRITNAMTL